MDLLLGHLISIKAIRGRDYITNKYEYIILYPTPLIVNDPRIYKYEMINICADYPYIGRYIDHVKKTVKDVVFNKVVTKSRCPFTGPWTIGWTYDYEYTSVTSGIMKLVNSAPMDRRRDPLFMATYICSRIDSTNDPINGIIEGRWEATFSGGREPMSWSNSRDVFKSRAELGGPVKYGQCWVLADILTGILNFIGIESRTVKIQPCIMDINDKNGVDYCIDSDVIKTRGGNNEIDPREATREGALVGNALSGTAVTGTVYAIDPNIKKDKESYYDLDYFINERMNNSWNYHVWTESKIHKSWYIYDPSPLHSVDISDFLPYKENRYHPSLQGLRYFGPINIKNIVENKRPKYIPHNFDYIYTCVNGQVRVWKTLMSKTCGTMLYLDDILYDTMKVSQRDAYGNINDVTSRYKGSYEKVHLNNPVYVSMKDNNMGSLYVTIRPTEARPTEARPTEAAAYVVQLCIFIDDTPVYIHREKMNKIDYDEFIFLKHAQLKKYRSKATRLTLTVYDITRNIFWSQCLKI